jgi:hypothetical protein
MTFWLNIGLGGSYNSSAPCLPMIVPDSWLEKKSLRLGESEIRPTIAVYEDGLPVDTESAVAHGGVLPTHRTYVRHALSAAARTLADERFLGRRSLRNEKVTGQGCAAVGERCPG